MGPDFMSRQTSSVGRTSSGKVHIVTVNRTTCINLGKAHIVTFNIEVESTLFTKASILLYRGAISGKVDILNVNRKAGSTLFAKANLF